MGRGHGRRLRSPIDRTSSRRISAGSGRHSPRFTTSRQRSSAGVQVGTPAGTRYTFEGAVATALGPRDDDWLASAVADPRIAIEVTPWWSDATDSRYLLNRALTLMWLEVRWRKPAVEGETGASSKTSHRLLSRPIRSTRPALSVARLG